MTIGQTFENYTNKRVNSWDDVKTSQYLTYFEQLTPQNLTEYMYSPRNNNNTAFFMNILTTMLSLNSAWLTAQTMIQPGSEKGCVLGGGGGVW